jgi:hypothetical protein
MQSQSISTIIDQIFVRQRLSCKGWQRHDIYQFIASRISALAGKTPAWTWRYIQSIRAKTVKASSRVDQAARMYLDVLLDQSTSPFSSYVRVQVRARPGVLVDGAFVLSESRPCSEPTCQINFVPRVPWQRYCPLHNHH